MVENSPNALLTSIKKSKVSPHVIHSWKKRKGQRAFAYTQYFYGENYKGEIGLFDKRRGLVYPSFIEDRGCTDCFLPEGYPDSYPARDKELGNWLLDRYVTYKITFNRAIIGGVGNKHKGPIHRVLSEPEHRTTETMLATFGLALHTFGPEGIAKLSRKYRRTNPNSSRALEEAANWLYMFQNPEEYFSLSMEKPIARFLGTTLAPDNVPPFIRAQWQNTPNFTSNVSGALSIQDEKNGLICPVFIEDRAHTDCFLPADYSYPDRDRELGKWLLDRYLAYKITFNTVIIGGVGKVHKGPIHRVLSEPEHRTTNPMLSTFGLALRNVGPGELYAFSQKYRKTNPNSSRAMEEAANWLYMFQKPEKYFSLSMEKPIGQFLGTTFTHDNIPKTVRAQWWERGFENLTGNMAGASAILDTRNGLAYPFFSVYYDILPGALLPKGYEPQEDHENLGLSFLKACGDCGQEILEEVLGIPKQAHAGYGLVAQGGCQILSATVGLALTTMLGNEIFAESVLQKLDEGVYYDLGLIPGLGAVVEFFRGNLRNIAPPAELEKLENILVNVAPGDPNDLEPDSGDEEDGDFKWEVKDQNSASKISRHPRFGKFYKDPTQKVGNKNIWWSKDQAGHGGSRFKLFKEYKNELRHFADIDAEGNVIPKHKGPIGRDIPRKELIGIK